MGRHAGAGSRAGQAVTFLDDRARLFGIVNVIDALAIVALLACAGVVVGYLPGRGSTPVMDAITPTEIQAGRVVQVNVSGHDLRPFLTAYVAKAGQPFSLHDADRYTQLGTYLFVAPDRAELRWEHLTAGTYDVYLYDEGKPVATRPSAFKVVVPEFPKGTMEVHVRFLVPDQAVGLMTVGDRDIVTPTGPNKPVPEGAVITELTVTNERAEGLDMRMVDRERAWIGRRIPSRVVDVRLEVPMLMTAPKSWEYKGDEGVRAGDIFTMTTDRYKLHGVVVWIGEVKKVAGE